MEDNSNVVRVMISLHVSTMAKSAEIIRQHLTELVGDPLEVWICTQMSGGEDYRDAIVSAVSTCDAFLIMMNENWALSGECKDEYNLAKRKNLTSHETGRTSRHNKDARLPHIVPLAFSDLNWSAHPHVELLAANTNFVVHPSSNLEESTPENSPSSIMNTVHALIVSLYKKGVISQIPDILKPSNTTTLEQLGLTRAYKTSSPKSELALMHDQLTALTSNLQSVMMSMPWTYTPNSPAESTLSLQRTGQNPSNNNNNSHEGVNMQPSQALGETYYGTLESDEILWEGGSTIKFWSLYEIHLTSVDRSCLPWKIEGYMVDRELRKRVDGKYYDKECPKDHPHYNWCSRLDVLQKDMSNGQYSPTTGLLSFTEVTDDGFVKFTHLIATKEKFLMGSSFYVVDGCPAGSMVVNVEMIS